MGWLPASASGLWDIFALKDEKASDVGSVESVIRLYVNFHGDHVGLPCRIVCGGQRPAGGIRLDATHNPLAGLSGDLYEIEAELAPEPGSAIEFNLRGVVIRYDAGAQVLACNDVQAPLPLEGGRIDLHMFLDRASVEVYANQGRVYVPLIHPMPPDNRRYSALAPRGGCAVEALRVHELRSIWPPPGR